MTKAERKTERKASLYEAYLALQSFAEETGKQELTLKEINAVIFSIGDDFDNANLKAKIKLEDVVPPEQDVSKAISRLIKWMRDHKITDKDILDCIIYICS